MLLNKRMIAYRELQAAKRAQAVADRDAMIREQNAARKARADAVRAMSVSVYSGQLLKRCIDAANRRIKRDRRTKVNGLAMTRTRLAAEVGTSTGVMSRYLDGKVPMPFHVFDSVLYVLEMSILDLLRPDEVAHCFTQFGWTEQTYARNAMVKNAQIKKVLDSTAAPSVVSGSDEAPDGSQD